MPVPSPSSAVRRAYPRRADISRAVEAVRSNGIRVASVTVGPDGSIKLSSVDDAADRKDTLFDELEKEGRL
jgi:hypothetical protein